jgi:hypothetical protein
MNEKLPAPCEGCSGSGYEPWLSGKADDDPTLIDPHFAVIGKLREHNLSPSR